VTTAAAAPRTEEMKPKAKAFNSRPVAAIEKRGGRRVVKLCSSRIDSVNRQRSLDGHFVATQQPAPRVGGRGGVNDPKVVLGLCMP